MKRGAAARFISEDPSRGEVGLVVEDVAPTATRNLTAAPELASIYGGGVAAVAERGDAPVPQSAVYRVLLTARTSQDVPDMALRGAVVIRGPSRSFLARGWTALSAIWVRQTGF